MAIGSTFAGRRKIRTLGTSLFNLETRIFSSFALQVRVGTLTVNVFGENKNETKIFVNESRNSLINENKNKNETKIFVNESRNSLIN